MLRHPFVFAGILLGMGLGGFVDGIVLHQILGWHHLVCVTEHCAPRSVEHLQQQNRQDGFFHLATLVLTTFGAWRVFRTATRPDTPRDGRAFWGAVLVGWGAFNFVEGVVDHHILGIHHVRPGSPHQLAWDLAFLASGVVFFVVGRAMVGAAFRSAPHPRSVAGPSSSSSS